MPASNEVGFACECVFPYHGRQCDGEFVDFKKTLK